MNRKIWTLALAFVALFALGALPMSAATTETTTVHFEVSSPEVGNAEFDLENPEVGDVEVFWTDTGEKIVVTYEEEGFLIEIDGKEIRVVSQVGVLHEIPEGATGFIFESDDEHEIVLDGSASNSQVMIWHSDDGEDGEGEDNKEIHIIRRHGATVEIDDDGESKVIHIPGGDDLEILRTKDEDGNEVIKVLRNGEEIDMEELAAGDANVRMIKMGEDGDAGMMHRVKIHEIEEVEENGGEGGEGNHIQIQVQISKKIEEE